MWLYVRGHFAILSSSSCCGEPQWKILFFLLVSKILLSIFFSFLTNRTKPDKNHLIFYLSFTKIRVRNEDKF